MNKSLREKLAIFFIILLCFCLSASSTYADRSNPAVHFLSPTQIVDIFPTDNAVLYEWNKMCKYPRMHPLLARSKLKLPVDTYQLNGINIDLVSNNELIGSLFVTSDWHAITLFSMDKQLYSERYNIVSAENAKGIAKNFIDTFYTNLDEKFNINYSEEINENGCYEFIFNYTRDDIKIHTIDVYVSCDGYIVKVVDIDGKRRFGSNIIEHIPQSPGEDKILKGAKEYAKLEGFADAEILRLVRQIIIKNKQPYYYWTGIATRNKSKLTAIVTYQEDSQKYTLSPWTEEDIATNIAFQPNEADDPVWSPDGKSVWWVTSSRWTGLPKWIVSPPPYSLSTSTIAISGSPSRPFLYRPLPDIGTLGQYYIRPSISPNSRWLVTLINTHRLIAIDLNNNRLFAIPGEHMIMHHLSWSSDSQQYVFVSNSSLYWMDTIGKDGIPFDVRERRIVLNTEIEQAEFLPHTKRLIAVVRREKLIGDKTDIYQLAYIDLPKNVDQPISIPKSSRGNDADHPVELHFPNIDQNSPLLVHDATITPILDLPDTPYSMHVLPGGAGAYLAMEDGVYQVTLANHNLTPIPWLAANKKIADDTYIPSGVEWDISPDGKHIVLTAYTKEKGPGRVICIANIDGKNVLRISGALEDRLERYRLNGINYFVPKEQITFGLMGQLGYEDFHDIEWPTTTWGPLGR